jgi:hypothetical protein
VTVTPKAVASMPPIETAKIDIIIARAKTKNKPTNVSVVSVQKT